MTDPDGLHHGDAAATLATWPDHCAQACVTSPPYLAQRRYGDNDLEGGTQTTLAGYVTWLADTLDQVRRVLRPDGLLWLNLGDKANGSGGAGGDWNTDSGRYKNSSNTFTAARGPAKFRDPDYLEASYLDVPGAVLRALLLRGWRLRLPIVWQKTRPAPEDQRHVRRPSWSHEMIYLLAPSSSHHRSRFYPTLLKQRGSVWTFPAGGQGPAHLAPFPDELARRCILPSTLPGDLVIDPFAGSGTTLRVATAHGRRAAGIDLYAPVARP